MDTSTNPSHSTVTIWTWFAVWIIEMQKVNKRRIANPHPFLSVHSKNSFSRLSQVLIASCQNNSLGKELVCLHDDPLRQKRLHSSWPWWNAFPKEQGWIPEQGGSTWIFLMKSVWKVDFNVGHWWFGKKGTNSEDMTVLDTVRFLISSILHWSLLASQDSITLGRTQLASMADLKTFGWGMSLGVNGKTLFLGFTLLHCDWIWCPAGCLQHQTFNFYSWCFVCPAVIWLALPFDHCDHRQFISPCQDLLSVYCFPQRTAVVTTQ